MVAFQTLFKAARLPFLALTPVCLLLAYALASRQIPDVSLRDAGLVFIGALAAHLAVNLLNEYQDFRSGLDLITRRTPFSGGSGALPGDPQSAPLVLKASYACLLLVCLVGGYFLFQAPLQMHTRLMLLIIGLTGLGVIVSYTRHLNRFPWLCLIAPGLGFGLLMVSGAVLLLAGEVTVQTLLLSLVPFFHINNLLLLNQYPDIEADKSVGRNHFVIAYGITSSNRIFAIFMLLPFLLLGLLLSAGLLPLLSAIALLPLVPGLVVAVKLARLREDIANSPQYLALNVAVTLATTLLLALSLLFA
ncbi:prenyltransferase [Thalassomonas actiniarum]|uniref:Prenyltransferase n=1 Tax=Thalassomonas actiniarum TaxID=485447 RepID=A0AAE9YY96_9GAMM|nr:prenyltransferase [Thalassomonas actiniarum]WDE02574.1 prenyltransferase [Thalassomonas actiniarum]